MLFFQKRAAKVCKICENELVWEEKSQKKWQIITVFREYIMFFEKMNFKSRLRQKWEWIGKTAFINGTFNAIMTSSFPNNSGNGV